MIFAAILLALTACDADRESAAVALDSTPAAEPPRSARMPYTVTKLGKGHATLTPATGDSVVRVSVDSMSRAPIIVGKTVVRRCKRGPYAGGRVVTWCRHNPA